MKKTTESDSNYDGLEGMSTSDLLKNINREDKTVAHFIEKQIPQIAKLVNTIVPKMNLYGFPEYFKMPSLTITNF